MDEESAAAPRVGVGTVRPGGRSAKVRAAVLDAVLDQLAAGGPHAVTVDAIAGRARVHKTTVYRRWPDRSDLIRDALADRLDAALHIPDTGDIDTDLDVLGRSVAAVLSSPLVAGVTRALVSASPDAEIVGLGQDYWAHRLAAVEPRIQAAIASGQLPAHTDPARLIRAVAAPLFFRLLVSRDVVEEATAAQAVRDALIVARHEEPPTA